MGLTTCLGLSLFGCLVLGPLTGVLAANCPTPDWFSSNGHCYKYFPQELSWERAEAICQRTGGHLASIQSSAEHRTIAAYVRQLQRWDDDDVWIGLRRTGQGWAWNDQSPVQYTAWKNEWDLDDSCVVLDEDSGFRIWDTDSCYDRNPFICKT